MWTKRRTWAAWAVLAGLAVGCSAPDYHVCPFDALIRCSREPIPDEPAPPVPAEPFAADRDRDRDRPLTLDALLAMAADRSRDLAQARARVGAARGRLPQ